MDCKLIESTAKLAARVAIIEAVAELKKQNFLKTKLTPFRKVETLLFNYNSFLAAVEAKREQIKDILAVGTPERSSSVTAYLGDKNRSYEAKNETEKANEKIEALESSIKSTLNYIKLIDSAVEGLKDDWYFKIIELRCFEGKSREAIAEYFGVDTSTISRHKNRLINILQSRLFADEYLDQIFC